MPAATATMAGGGVGVVARMYVVIGLAVAGFALFAMSFDPATFQQLQLQMIKDLGHQPVQGQAYCAATAAEAISMRANAVLLLLWAAAQALCAMAMVATPSRAGIVCMQGLSLAMALKLGDVLTGVVHVAIGRCLDHGSYHQVLVAGYVIVAVHFGMLFIHGVDIAHFSKVDG